MSRAVYFSLVMVAFIVITGRATAQISNPLDVPVPEQHYPPIHLVVYATTFEHPGEQLGVGGGFEALNENIHAGFFFDYTYMATGSHLRTTMFAAGRNDRADVGLLNFGAIYLPVPWFSVQGGFSYGDASLAVKNPVEASDGSVESALGMSFGADVHLFRLLNLGIGTRYHHRWLGSDVEHHPDVFSYELKVGVTVTSWD